MMTRRAYIWAMTTSLRSLTVGHVKHGGGSSARAPEKWPDPVFPVNSEERPVGMEMAVRRGILGVFSADWYQCQDEDDLNFVLILYVIILISLREYMTPIIQTVCSRSFIL